MWTRPCQRQRWRKREGDAQLTGITERTVISFGEVGRDHLSVVTCNRREPRPKPGSIACRINRRFAHALEVFVELEAAAFDSNVGGFAVQPVESWSATGRVCRSFGGRCLAKPAGALDKVLHLCGGVQGERVLRRAGARRNEVGELLDRGKLLVACR